MRWDGREWGGFINLRERMWTRCTGINWYHYRNIIVVILEGCCATQSQVQSGLNWRGNKVNSHHRRLTLYWMWGASCGQRRSRPINVGHTRWEIEAHTPHYTLLHSSWMGDRLTKWLAGWLTDRLSLHFSSYTPKSTSTHPHDLRFGFYRASADNIQSSSHNAKWLQPVQTRISACPSFSCAVAVLLEAGLLPSPSPLFFFFFLFYICIKLGSEDQRHLVCWPISFIIIYNLNICTFINVQRGNKNNMNTKSRIQLLMKAKCANCSLLPPTLSPSPSCP